MQLFKIAHKQNYLDVGRAKLMMEMMMMHEEGMPGYNTDIERDAKDI